MSCFFLDSIWIAWVFAILLRLWFISFFFLTLSPPTRAPRKFSKTNQEGTLGGMGEGQPASATAEEPAAQKAAARPEEERAVRMA